jgi:hypothetical protein
VFTKKYLGSTQVTDEQYDHAKKENENGNAVDGMHDEQVGVFLALFLFFEHGGGIEIV